MLSGGLEMVRYRVTHIVEESFGCKFNQTLVIESEIAISRKEIASKLSIDIDSIINIEVI
jgi:hypothetical protein